MRYSKDDLHNKIAEEIKHFAIPRLLTVLNFIEYLKKQDDMIQRRLEAIEQQYYFDG